MFSSFLKRVYLFTFITTLIGITIFLINGNSIEYNEILKSIIGVYLKIVVPFLIAYIIWKWVRDGFIGWNKIIVMFINSIIYTILTIDILIILFYITSKII